MCQVLLGVPRLVPRMQRQPYHTSCEAWSDSDWAGCKRTRRSTSCFVLMHGQHFLKMGSTTQQPVSLSSGEAEWHSAVRAGSALVGLVNMAKDLGRTLDPTLRVDASAAIGIASRRGVGKVRHLDVRTLWLQRLITDKLMKIAKTPGKENCADLGTKHLGRVEMWKHLNFLGFKKLAGRSSLSLRAALP